MTELYTRLDAGYAEQFLADEHAFTFSCRPVVKARRHPIHLTTSRLKLLYAKLLVDTYAPLPLNLQSKRFWPPLRA